MGETNDAELLERAAAVFTRRVHEISASAWRNPTPDADWDVRALVNHLVTEHRWVPPLLGGESVDDIGDRFDGDLLGTDPAAAWDDAWAASSRAWAELATHRDEDRAVQLSSGPTPACSYREEMIFDLVVHAWDLARGAGLDETGDPEAVRRALEVAERSAEDWAGSSMFADPVEVGSDDPLHRLLGLTGRRP